MMLHKERNYTLSQAYDKVIYALAYLKLTHKLIEIASEPYAYLCEIIDGSGEKYLGFGKGSKEEAKVGALFEVLEHYISNMHQIPLSEISLEKTLELKSFGDVKTPISEIINRQKNKKIACVAYQSLTSPNASLSFFPIFLSTANYVTNIFTKTRSFLGDDFNYNPLHRYASGSGTAIGSNKVEALLHAINEVIERDALSFFLLETFFKIDTELTPIAIDSLPISIKKIYDKSSKHLETPIYLFELKNEFLIPCYMAWSARNTGERGYVGYGCSLNAEYAVYRALTEIVQSAAKIPNLPESEIVASEKKWKKEMNQLKSYKGLERCAMLDLKPLLTKKEANFQKEKYTIPNIPEAQLQLLINKLKDHGFTVWYHEYTLAKKAGISLVHVVIPGMENFYMTTMGKPVVPNERGLTYINHN